MDKLSSFFKTRFGKFSKKFSSYKKELKENRKKRLTLTLGILLIFIIILLYSNIQFIVAATVNGVPITRFKLISELEKQGGKQVLESLITQELIKQESKKQNIIVTQEMVDSEVKSVEEQLKTQGMDLDTALSMQGQTREDFIQSIKSRIALEKMLLDKVIISDQEIKDYFNENKDSFPKGATLDSVKSQIETQLRSQKLSEEYQKWLNEVKTSNSINYLLNY